MSGSADLFGVTDMTAAVVHRIAEQVRDEWHVERIGQPTLAFVAD